VIRASASFRALIMPHSSSTARNPEYLRYREVDVTKHTSKQIRLSCHSTCYGPVSRPAMTGSFNIIPYSVYLSAPRHFNSRFRMANEKLDMGEKIQIRIRNALSPSIGDASFDAVACQTSVMRFPDNPVFLQNAIGQKYRQSPSLPLMRASCGNNR